MTLKRLLNLTAALLAVSAPGLMGTVPTSAAEEVVHDYGISNPQELTLGYFARKAEDEAFDPKMCRFGYPAAKMGDQETARIIFERCAMEGNTPSMSWMSWLDENGYDRPRDPEAAAEWDRRAAKVGDPVGQLNHGLNLLRGHGVTADTEAGRAMIDRAAARGMRDAVRVKDAGYDWRAGTPDVDEERYEKKLY